MGKADKTRQFIIAQTAPLFNTKGYAATTLSDITAVTGLTKGSIYGNFTDKEEVVKEAFLYNTTALHTAMEANVAVHKTATDQLTAILQFYRTGWTSIIIKGGCPYLNAATEADDNLLFLKDTVREQFTSWVQYMAALIKKGQHNGEFHKEADPDKYASTFIMLIEGGILLSRSMGKSDALYTALDRIAQIIRAELIL